MREFLGVVIHALGLTGSFVALRIRLCEDRRPDGFLLRRVSEHGRGIRISGFDGRHAARKPYSANAMNAALR